ncbi:MAG TPA: glycosyltransferase family 4 protein, partial [Candidatus Acidoferrales bacterium]|nr:glycosyltransferase family 4 protein [Candidatus Acidoferrales bacterium]
AVVGRALRSADWIAACSVSVRSELLSSIPALADRCSVIYNSLPDSDARPPVPLPSLPRLLCLGRLVDEKGFDIALAAFAAACAAGVDVNLTVAGDGPLRSQLEAQARQLGIKERVDFLGWVHPHQTAALIDSATAVLMPSRRDPMPLVGLETALRARPLIATRAGGLAEMVLDGDTGILIDIGDVCALQEAIVYLLGDRRKATVMGERARAHVDRSFPWRRHVDSYHGLYAQLSQRRRVGYD